MHDLLHSAVLRNGTFIAIIAHGVIGISLVWDKVLLLQPETRNVVSYVFWLGAMSILGLALIPFGFHRPPAATIALALGAGCIHLVAVFFYYEALDVGEASNTLAVMGGFSPVATVLIAVPLLSKSLGDWELIAFALLTSAGFLMFMSERVDYRKILPFVLAASAGFGLVNVLQKLAFDNTNFVSGYVFFTIGTVLGALALLARRSWRQQIFEYSEHAQARSRFWYFVNRFVSGVGSFLTFYAISLQNPAIVDAITGVRYVLIFLGALLITYWKPIWLRENFSGRVLIFKIVATLLVTAGLMILGLTSEPSQAHLRQGMDHDTSAELITATAVPAHTSQSQNPPSDANPRALEAHISPAKFPAGSWRR